MTTSQPSSIFLGVTRRILLLGATAILVVSFSVPAGRASAAGLVACNPTIDSATNQIVNNCGYDQLAQTINNVVSFLIVLGVAVSVFTFAYAGFLYMSAGAGESESLTKAKGIFTKTVVGIVIMLAAWLIVNTVFCGLVLDATKGSLSPWWLIGSCPA